MSFGHYVDYRKRQGSTNLSRVRKAFQYGQKTDWCSPNSTDVKSVKDVRNLAKYLAKYMTKSLVKKGAPSQSDPRLAAFTGNIWYCSTSLSRLSTYKTQPSRRAMSFLDAIEKLKKSLYCCYEYVECLYFDISELKGKILKELKQVLVHHALATGYSIQNG